MNITKNDITLKLSILFIGIFSLFFTMSYTAHADCVYDGENFHIQNDPSAIMTPIHRLYNTSSGVHLYTRGVFDANKILGKWHEFNFTDGVPAFCMFLSQQSGLTPIYRLYNTRTGVHLYARGEADKNKILSKWSDFEFTDSSPAFWASLNQQSGLTPIYRLYNKRTGVHLYARGEADKNKVLSTWSDFEFTDGSPAFWAHTTSDSGPELFKYMGPTISVGLYAYSESELEDNSFRIKSTKSFIVKDKNGTKIATIPANSTTKVKYLDDSDHTLRIYESIPEITASEQITFESATGNPNEMIFEIVRPEMNFSEYRGSIRLQYSNNDGTKRIWMINDIPLEYYIWGMGEITGTGPMGYNELMTTAYRTYGYWKILYSTKYATEGFKLNATPGNQLYYGYEWEQNYPRIREGAESTRGKIAKHGSDVALTPYSSWTDGRTRSFEEHWGSTLYPWCQSVSDSYGNYNGDYYDNAYKSTSDLVASGNHMVGISAHGALTLANDKDWNWDRIMKYYLDGINIISIY